MSTTVEEAARDSGAEEPPGKTIEQMAAERADEPGEEPEAEGPQLVIPGTGAKLSGAVGGKRPTDSKFKVRAISLPISGGLQMDKDETVWVAIECAIDSVSVENHRDGREIVGVTRTHTAYPLGAPVLLDGPPETAAE